MNVESGSVKIGEFSVEAAFTDGDTVLMCGKVFELGDYPDKDFSISPGEMDDAIASFSPVGANLEHSRISTVLGNALGGLQRLWRSGRHVLGEVSVPRWLAELTGGRLNVSLEFDRAKRVVGIGYTLNPRITDAQVAAAFSASRQETAVQERGTGNDERGEGALLQEIGDSRLEIGAHGAGTRTATSSGAFTQVFQAVHPHGPSGPGDSSRQPELPQSTGEFMSKTLKERVLAWFKRSGPEDIEELELEAALGPPRFSADAATLSSGISPTPQPPPSLTNQSEGWGEAEIPSALGGDLTPLKTNHFEGGGDSGSGTHPERSPTPQPPPSKTNHFEGGGAVEDLRRNNELIAARFAESEAERFADDAIAQHRAFPVEREKIIAAYRAALEADGGGKFSFTLGKLTEGKYVQAVRELIEARPAHQMTTEAIPGIVLSTDGSYFSGKSMEGGRKKQLLAHSDTGTEALRSREAR